MKSDREFLAGVYDKAKEFATNQEMLPPRIKQPYHKQNTSSNRNYLRRIRYSAIAASFLLLLSATVYQITNIPKQSEADIPSPSVARMLSYTEQLFEDATEIIEVRAIEESNQVELVLTHTYKGSFTDLTTLNVNNELFSLSKGQTAILFLQVNLGNTQIMDIFLFDEGNDIYRNSYGEVITTERLEDFQQDNNTK